MLYKTRRDPAHRSWRTVPKATTPAAWRLLPRLFVACSSEDWVTLALFLTATVYLLYSESFWSSLHF